MSDSISAPVDESTRKLVDASTRSRSGRLRNPSTDDPSSLPGLRGGHARELIGDRRRRHRLPRRERAAHGVLEIGGGDAGDAAVGDEVADRRLRPFQRSPAVRRSARRTSDTRAPARRGRTSATTATAIAMRPPHFAASRQRADASARSRRARSARRDGSPRTSADGPGRRRQQHRRASRASRSCRPRATTRNTPWLSPSTCGTLGPRAPRNTTTRSIDRELRRADDDAAEASELAAGHAETQRRSERALQVALDLERHDGLDRAAIFGPLRVERGDAAARDGQRVARQLAEIGRDEHRRPRRDGQREHACSINTNVRMRSV